MAMRNFHLSSRCCASDSFKVAPLSIQLLHKTLIYPSFSDACLPAGVNAAVP